MSAVLTTCPYCGVGCGVQAQRGLEVAGDEAHPANRGRLCVKGSALSDTVGLEGRLLYPMVRDNREPFRRVDWGTALRRVADGLAQTIARHGPDAVALYVSGQLLTEDYYAANKLAKGFLGTANIDTNSRLCMSSAVAGHKRAFGSDSVPGCYEDFEQADLVVLVGSNAAWCHPVLYQRLIAARQARNGTPRLVVIDPRRTATCEDADLHLPVKPGSDVWLFNGLLAFLHRQGATDARYVEAHTTGADTAVAAALQTTGSTAQVARACGVAEEPLLEFFRLFAATKRVVTAFSQGVNQSSSGVDKVNSIINCHLLTGRIGAPGMGPFSITGQPNAMGGREVGGLATALAAHLELGNAEHRALLRGFWNCPSVPDTPGLKAVDLFDAIHEGRVKAVWIMATNPVVSLPDADRVRAALGKCELVVVSEAMARTDTGRHAHVLLPAAAWGEKDGTVTNSERRISRQRAFLPPAGDARPDWWIVAEVARHMGFGDAFSWKSAHDVFAEHARLSAHGQARLPRAFNLAGLTALSREQYDALAPVQWPVPTVGHPGTPRLFADGRFHHRESRAHLVPLVPRAPAHEPDDEFPLVLNTGRVRDQWHTMSRTGKSPKLASHCPEPFLEIHPQDAIACGLRDGGLARLQSRWGACVLRVKAQPTVVRGQVFAPIHWNDQTASDARIGAVVNPVVDPLSGEPEFKHTPVRAEPFDVDWHGFVLARRPLPREALGPAAWWTAIAGARFIRYELAGRGTAHDWRFASRTMLDVTEAGADWLEASDLAEGMFRAAHVVDDRIQSCLFVSPRAEDLPVRAWLSTLFVQDRLAEPDRASLLAGAPADPQADPGPTVCSCFGVGRNVIVKGIREQKLGTVEALGASLQCGTNCGSCVPELKALLAEARAQAA